MDGDGQYGQWRREIFGDPYVVWHEGPGFEALVEAARREPGVVERMLRAGLAEGDTVAAQSFGALAEAGLAPADAVSILRTALIRARAKTSQSGGGGVLRWWAMLSSSCRYMPASDEPAKAVASPRRWI